MKAAIIAAGVGERLTLGGIRTPKPLVPVGGRPLIERIIGAAARLGMSSAACIVNDVQRDVAEFLRSTSWPIPLELTVKTTPSSMESLFCLEPFLREEPFLLFTVDVVFGFATVRDFLAAAQECKGAAGVLALTDHIDDEKPLWAKIQGDSRITALGDTARGSRYVTAGFYYFEPTIFSLVDAARRRNLTALRQFLGLLIATGHSLCGLPVAKTIDVDYAEDIQKADRFLKEINER
ncbi:nucleotidyltransferase family protein [Desulfoferrobacter suflitae]|uniref:nucleotidyltransferase family protein n=1 Tax=Desulfoferrobacter suflitae TaxID=2865782 RepID=UPI002164D531|nr:NTP transferase domain-containing protein [Desulfoferrobacter suflitae]MCK8604069.1 NTP transferase domain-containing protein [Desulfoferrobacter suflitae]